MSGELYLYCVGKAYYAGTKANGDIIFTTDYRTAKAYPESQLTSPEFINLSYAMPGEFRTIGQAATDKDRNLEEWLMVNARDILDSNYRTSALSDFLRLNPDRGTIDVSRYLDLHMPCELGIRTFPSTDTSQEFRLFFVLVFKTERATQEQWDAWFKQPYGIPIDMTTRVLATMETLRAAELKPEVLRDILNEVARQGGNTGAPPTGRRLNLGGK